MISLASILLICLIFSKVIWLLLGLLFRKLRLLLLTGLVGFLMVAANFGPDLAKVIAVDLTVHRHTSWLERKDITPLMMLALQAAEDERFSQRALPVDGRSIVRALKENLFYDGKQGASTLTMQVARTAFPLPLANPQEDTIRRKFLEMVMAWRIERKFEKNEIIELYFNTVSFAGGQPGFRRASLKWFGREPKDLNAHEVFALVYSARAPSRINSRKDLMEAAARFIRNAAARGFIHAEPGTRVPLELNFRAENAPLPATLLVQRAQDEWTSGLLNEHLRSLPTDLKERIEKEHLVLHSTINFQLQHALQETVLHELSRLQVTHPEILLEVALAVVNASDGKVLALVQRDPERAFSFNTQALRQIGSLEKPLVLLASLQTGRFSITHRMFDAPLPNGYPRNSGGKRYGSVTLQRALEVSANTVFVRLFQDEAVRIRLERLHDISGLPPVTRDLSTALGTLETTNLHLASVYAAIASGGRYHPPYLVGSVSSADGRNTIFRQDVSPRVLASENEVEAIQTAMRGVYLHGTGSSLKEGLMGGVKTGTTSVGFDNVARDLRIAYVLPGQFAVTIWVGAERGSLWRNASAGEELSALAGAVFSKCEGMIH